MDPLTRDLLGLEEGLPRSSDGLYDLIYADPPWDYDVGTAPKKSQAPGSHYRTMSVTEIGSLRVPAARDAALYLWATAPFIPFALDVMTAWGFRYKTCAVWDKVRLGIGYWFRGQHELLLVGTRGKIRPPAAPARRSSMFRVPRGAHSAKPSEVRAHLEIAFPTARRLEMFARERTPGWAVWGDEVASDVAISGSDITHDLLG
jgi:N6-adenosine-specific RNA methylase IME4